MDAWLIDVPLLKGTSPPAPLRKRLTARKDPLFLSAASLLEIGAAIARMPKAGSARASELLARLEILVEAFGDRDRPIDVGIACRAGGPAPFRQNERSRHRGQGLLTPREDGSLNAALET